MPKRPPSRKSTATRKTWEAGKNVKSRKPKASLMNDAAASTDNGDADGNSPDLRMLAPSFPVVGIGASAGGLEAFTALLAALPADTGMAFVLIQHMDPKHESLLQGLLQKATPMPVLQVRDGMAVEPNHIYVIPPNTLMTIAGRTLKLRSRPDRFVKNLPIDHFLVSMADSLKFSAVGVILSGTASDGTAGLKAIKAEGGVTFAQDKSAHHTGMPLSAIAAGCVDFTLPPDRIAGELARISRHAYIQTVHRSEAPHAPEIADDGLSQICTLLLKHTGVDFGLYRQATIGRRVARRMAVRKMDTREHYVRLLLHDQIELTALYEDIFIHVTGFFRDAAVMEALRVRVVPGIVSRQGPSDIIRVWAPGCSTGEEVYTIAMMFFEQLNGNDGSARLQIFGTDISENAIERARVGIFPESAIKSVSRERQRRFFSKVEGGYQVSKRLREVCVFARHDLARDPPFSKIDLLTCRNVLIYMAPLLQKRVVENLHYALRPDGFLLLGKAESLGAYPHLFSVRDPKNKVFARVAYTTLLHPAAAAVVRQHANRVPAEIATAPMTINLRRETERILLEQHAPAAFVVDADLQIVHFQGNTSRFLAPATGEPSFHLLRLVRPEIVVPLRGAIQQVKKEGATVRLEGIRLKHGGNTEIAGIQVSPMRGSQPGELNYLVVFHEPTSAAARNLKPAKRRPGSPGLNSETEALLHQELDSTREQLQAIVHDHQAAVEELRAMNEEVLSGNEELQSTNEELETAKEELESSNEELHTLNEELQNRNVELSQLGDDLSNLLTGVRIPIVFLDAALRIRRFTPAAGEVLNLIATDIGRPLNDIASALSGAGNLGELAAEVIEQNKTIEREVRDRNNQWFGLRIRPYKTMGQKIDGVLLALLDIDALKRSFDETRAAREFADAIVDTLREPLLVLDGEFRIVRATRKFYDTFQVTQTDTEGRVLYTLGNGQWDVPGLRELLEDILPRDSRFEEFKLEHHFPSIGYRFMILSARKIQQANSSVPLILLAIEDATRKRLMEEERLIPKLMAAQEEERKRVARELHDGLTQDLAGLAIDMGRHAAKHPTTPALLTKQFRSLQARTVRAAEAVRRIAYELHPSEIDDLGLEAALRSYSEEFAQREGVAVECSCRNMPPDLHRDILYCLYKIAQESLRNIAKHAAAKQAKVSIECNANVVRLSVEDNGAGFRIESLRLTAGLGIVSMRERLKSLNGIFSIVSKPGKGTQMVAEIPLRELL